MRIIIILLKIELISIRNNRQYSRLQTAHFRRPRYFISFSSRLSKEQNEKTEKMIPLELLEKCSILNNMPLAYI